MTEADQGIKVSVYEDKDRTFIASTSSVLPSLSCAGLCLGCLPTSKDFCTVCTPGYLLSEAEGTCTEKCPSGSLFLTDTGNCEKCATQCSECSTQADKCDKCAQDGFVVTETGQCLSEAIC